MLPRTTQLFPKCRKLAYDARQRLSQVQNGVLSPSDLHVTLEELTRQLDLMEQLVLRETPQQRDGWKRKILEIREEQSRIQREGEKYDRIVTTSVRHQRERDELLTRRRRGRKDMSAGERDMQNLADEGASWQQSHSMVNDLIANGEASLDALVGQRQRLSGVNRFLSRIDDTLGVSDATMKMVERRDITDAYFVFGGMVITCITFYIVWF